MMTAAELAQEYGRKEWKHFMADTEMACRSGGPWGWARPCTGAGRRLTARPPAPPAAFSRQLCSVWLDFLGGSGPQKFTQSKQGGTATAQEDSTGWRGERESQASQHSLPPFLGYLLLASAKNATQNRRKQKSAKTYTTVPERDGWVCGKFLRDLNRTATRALGRHSHGARSNGLSHIRSRLGSQCPALHTGLESLLSRPEGSEPGSCSPQDYSLALWISASHSAPGAESRQL